MAEDERCRRVQEESSGEDDGYHNDIWSRLGLVLGTSMIENTTSLRPHRIGALVN